MAESEVETILREIRERVLAEQRAPSPLSRPDADNGNQPGDVSREIDRPIDNAVTTEKLALIDSHLVTLSRAWDRLPPIVSNRSGVLASIELWIKQRFKRASRWYSWEQVNFNASAHQAIRDILQVLINYQQEFERLQAKRQADAEKHQNELSDLRAELETQQHLVETQRATLEIQRQTLEAQPIEFNAQLGRVLGELRERIAQVQEEHRVSFKQLSLESTEAAALEERARRKTMALIEELRMKVKSDEGKSDE